jgi:hypothetical protein
MHNQDSHDTTSFPAGEEWRPVPGYEGLYEVSDHGNVRSLPRMTRTGVHGGQVLKPQPDGHGYWHLQLSRDNQQKTFKVYALVAAAFIGPRPPGYDVRHGPAGKGDDSLANLCYGTRAQNEQDKKRDGTFRQGVSRGEAHGCAKLTEGDVRSIRQRLADRSVTQTALAAEYGVTQANISLIATRQKWQHVL